MALRLLTIEDEVYEMLENPLQDRGFTLIELLVVVAILGLVSTIAVANLTNAIDKGRQKRSMADIHSIAEAVEAYHIDQSAYPRAVADWSMLESHVTPFFIKTPPPSDGWANGWWVATDAAGTNYSLVSFAKDGVQGPWDGGQTKRFECDIVYTGGQFFQWPEGAQE